MLIGPNAALCIERGVNVVLMSIHLLLFMSQLRRHIFVCLEIGNSLNYVFLMIMSRVLQLSAVTIVNLLVTYMLQSRNFD